MSRTGAFAAGAVTALVLGGGSAYAANGGSFLLGRANTATATSTLTNTKGTPLSLGAPAGTAPLAVSSGGRVTNLNADKVDGLHAGSFLRSNGKAADAEAVDGINGGSIALTGGRTGIVWGHSKDPDGFANTARCPAGTVATGGGGYTTEPDDFLGYSGPDYNEDDDVLIANSWLVMSDGYSVAFVTCYNPRGAVKGAATQGIWVQSPAQAVAAAAGAPQKRLSQGRP